MRRFLQKMEVRRLSLVLHSSHTVIFCLALIIIRIFMSYKNMLAAEDEACIIEAPAYLITEEMF